MHSAAVPVRQHRGGFLFYVISILVENDFPPPEIEIRYVPSLVLAPIFHDQLTMPSESDVLVSSPSALLGPEDYMTVML